MEIAATPPMTPPTIAPVLELLFTGGEGVGDLDGPRTVPGPSSGESIKKKKKGK